MKTGTVKADILLLLTATIWGFAFVAQRVGMDFVGPFTFNAVRFALGSLSLLPLILLLEKKQTGADSRQLPDNANKSVWLGGLLTGGALFAGASLQQAGLVYTTAGKAGFITGLYVVIVPLLGLFWHQRPRIGTWLGAILAAVGLYFLSITSEFHISFGDLLVLIGAFFWAGHVLLIGWLAPRTDSLKHRSDRQLSPFSMEELAPLVLPTLCRLSLNGMLIRPIQRSFSALKVSLPQLVVGCCWVKSSPCVVFSAVL